MPKSISQEYLKSILRYDPNSGIFTWKISISNNQIFAGDVAGYSANHGNRTNYIMIGIDRESYRAHRLAFLYMTGNIPKLIDHKDKDGTNNKWNNLRDSNKSLNAANTKKRSDNTSGHKGVSYRSDPRRVKKWRACIVINGKQKVIGTYHTKEEAADAYNKAAIEHFGEFSSI